MNRHATTDRVALAPANSDFEALPARRAEEISIHREAAAVRHRSDVKAISEVYGVR
jgi:hypothetical protein